MTGPGGPGSAPAPDRAPAPGGPAQVPQCHGDVCITCSDTAVEVTVRRLLADGMAVVDTGAGEEEVSVALVTVQPGDTILVHAGEAIATVGKGSAGEMS